MCARDAAHSSKLVPLSSSAQLSRSAGRISSSPPLRNKGPHANNVRATGDDDGAICEERMACEVDKRGA